MRNHPAAQGTQADERQAFAQVGFALSPRPREPCVAQSARSLDPSVGTPARGGPSAWGEGPLAFGSIDDGAHDLDADPERVELVLSATAEVVVLVPALLVVEADPQALLVVGHLDFQRLARR